MAAQHGEWIGANAVCQILNLLLKSNICCFSVFGCRIRRHCNTYRFILPIRELFIGPSGVGACTLQALRPCTSRTTGRHARGLNSAQRTHWAFQNIPAPWCNLIVWRFIRGRAASQFSEEFGIVSRLPFPRNIVKSPIALQACPNGLLLE